MPRTRATRYRRWALLLSVGPILAAPAPAQPADVLALGGADAATEAVFVRGLTAQWLGDHEGAVALFTRVLERRPEEPAVLAALARSDAALGRSAEALSLISRAASLAPDNPTLLTELADLQRELGRDDDAAATIERLLRNNPDDARGWDTLAEIHESAGRTDQAVHALEQLLRTGGEDESVRLRMHAQVQRLGDPDRARSVLAEAVEAIPASRALRLRLARAYNDAGRTDSAAAVLDALLQRDPSDAEAAALRDEIAGVAPRISDSEDSAARLRRAGAMLLQLDEDPSLEPALRELIRPLADGPDAPSEALRVLGLLERRTGNHATAAELLARSLTADPRHDGAWLALVDSHRLAGDARAAAGAADEALLLFPGQPALLEAAASAYAAAGRIDDARDALDEALGLNEADGLHDAMRERLVRARETLD